MTLLVGMAQSIHDGGSMCAKFPTPACWIGEFTLMFRHPTVNRGCVRIRHVCTHMTCRYEMPMRNFVAGCRHEMPIVWDRWYPLDSATVASQCGSSSAGDTVLCSHPRPCKNVCARMHVCSARFGPKTRKRLLAPRGIRQNCCPSTCIFD